MLKSNYKKNNEEYYINRILYILTILFSYFLFCRRLVYRLLFSIYISECTKTLHSAVANIIRAFTVCSPKSRLCKHSVRLMNIVSQYLNNDAKSLLQNVYPYPTQYPLINKNHPSSLNFSILKALIT